MSKILLVDDDADMLAMVERWLVKGGYEVTKVTSGQAALDAMTAAKPDLVLLDYAMPEMDGPAVLKEIRGREDLSGVPVLYRTGMEDTSFDADGVSPDGIVPKSEGKPALMQAIEKALA